VKNVMIRQRGDLDWSYIESHLGPLAELKEEPEIMAELDKLRREFAKPRPTPKRRQTR
jgi:hypothetical protein